VSWLLYRECKHPSAFLKDETTKLIKNRNDSIERQSGSAYSSQLFRVVGLPPLIGMILSIVGMTTASSLTAGMNSKLTKAGIILFLITWVLLLVVHFLIWVRYASVERGEHRLVWAATICMPVLAVRLAYSALDIFDQGSTFNMFTGNVTVFLVMDVLEEIFIVYVMVLTGMTLDIKAPAPTPDQSKYGPVASDVQFENVGRQQQAGANQYARDTEYTGASAGSYAPPQTQYKKYPYKGGPIRKLITWAINETNERRAR
jgi:hypothetical protein